MDTDLAPATPYRYRVQACNKAWYSPFGGPVSVSTFGTIPITTLTLPGAVIGDSLRASLQSNGGTGAVTFTLIAGALPGGVTLNPAGVLSGTPTATVAFPITVRATSPDGQTATIDLGRAGHWQVAPFPLNLTRRNAPAASEPAIFLTWALVAQVFFVGDTVEPRPPLRPGVTMAKIMIVKKNGTKTPYFWLDRDTDRTHLTVYKKTSDGIKRMKGVHFDAVANRVHRH